MMARGRAVSGVEVLGWAILSIRGALEFLKLKAQRLLAAHGLASIEAEQWYSLPNVIAALEAIREQVDPHIVRSIGYWVPSNARFPPGVDSFEGALHALDAAYRMNHRGEGDFGHYQVVEGGENTLLMRSDSPYPCDFDQGLLEALYDRFQPPSSVRLHLTHETGDCRIQGADACVYRIRW